jgi:hypothetical protein
MRASQFASQGFPGDMHVLVNLLYQPPGREEREDDPYQVLVKQIPQNP